MASYELKLSKAEREAIQWLAGIDGVDAPKVATFQDLAVVEVVDIDRDDENGGRATFTLTDRGREQVERIKAAKAKADAKVNGGGKA